MSADPLWSIGLVILGAAITLVANLISQMTTRRMDASARWDTARLDAFSNFTMVMTVILRSPSKASARAHLPELAAVFEKVVLLGSTEAVQAAERARTAGAAYVYSLPDRDEDCEDADGDAVAYTADGVRRVVLSEESSRLQLAAFREVNALIQATRKQLGIKSLDADVMGRPI